MHSAEILLMWRRFITVLVSCVYMSHQSALMETYVTLSDLMKILSFITPIFSLPLWQCTHCKTEFVLVNVRQNASLGVLFLLLLYNFNTMAPLATTFANYPLWRQCVYIIQIHTNVHSRTQSNPHARTYMICAVLCIVMILQTCWYLRISIYIIQVKLKHFCSIVMQNWHINLRDWNHTLFICPIIWLTH